MGIEEAIITALEYETKVRDLYIQAMKDTQDEGGKKIFHTLAKEEQGHLDYLNERLKHWKETGKLDVPVLKTILPSKQAIIEGAEKLSNTMSAKSRENELELLNKALEAEIETSKFYNQMVSNLSNEEKELFQRFLEIEEGHVAIVQAEVDAISGSGFWFDFTDISLEMG